MVNSLFDMIFRTVAKTNLISRVLLIFVLGSSLVLVGFGANAQSPGNRGLIVSPIINDIEAERGQSYDYSLDLYNDTPNYKYDIDITKQTFVPSGTDGVPELADFSKDNDYSFWLNFDKDKLSIDATKKEVVQAKISIPNDAKPGGYYFAIIFSDNPNSSNNLGAGVRIKQRIVSLLFVNVKGQVEKNVKFTKVETNQKIYDPFLDAINLKYTIRVEGGTYVKPSGNVFLNDGSRAGVDRFSLNPLEKIILPNSSRTFVLKNKSNLEVPILSTKVEAQEVLQKENDSSPDSVSEEKINWSRLIFGNQKIEARVIYTDSEGKITQQAAQTEIFYFPWKTLLILAIVLAIFGFAYFKFRPKVSKE